jgi:hypothetical protein
LLSVIRGDGLSHMRLNAQSNTLFKKCHLSFETVSARHPYLNLPELLQLRGQDDAGIFAAGKARRRRISLVDLRPKSNASSREKTQSGCCLNLFVSP